MAFSIYSIIWDIFETILIIGLISIPSIIFTWYSTTSDSADSNYNQNRKNALTAGLFIFALIFISTCSSIWHYNDNNRAIITDAVRNAGGSYTGALDNYTQNYAQKYVQNNPYFQPRQN